MKSAIVGVLILGAAGFAGTAKADSWNFFFPSGPNSNVSLGNSFTFTSTGGVSITASGFTDSGTATAIFDKFASPGYQNGLSETGLGLTSEDDHEIDTSGYVELNLGNIVNGTIVTLSMGSVQTGEAYNVYETNTLGGKGPESGGTGFTTLGTNETLNATTDAATFSFTKSSSFQYIAVEETAANSGDILLSTLSTATPEPGYYVLLFVGMAGLALTAIRRQRRQARQVAA